MQCSEQMGKSESQKNQRGEKLQNEKAFQSSMFGDLVDKDIVMGATMDSKLLKAAAEAHVKADVQNKNSGHFFESIPNNIKCRRIFHIDIYARLRCPTKRFEDGRGFCWQQHCDPGDVQACG